MAWTGNRYGDGATTSTLSNLGTVTGVTGPIHILQCLIKADKNNTGQIYYGGTEGTLTTAGAYAFGVLEAGESRTIFAEFNGNLSDISIIGSDGAQKAYIELVFGPSNRRGV